MGELRHGAVRGAAGDPPARDVSFGRCLGSPGAQNVHPAQDGRSRDTQGVYPAQDGRRSVARDACCGPKQTSWARLGRQIQRRRDVLSAFGCRIHGRGGVPPAKSPPPAPGARRRPRGRRRRSSSGCSRGTRRGASRGGSSRDRRAPCTPSRSGRSRCTGSREACHLPRATIFCS